MTATAPYQAISLTRADTEGQRAIVPTALGEKTIRGRELGMTRCLKTGHPVIAVRLVRA
jgi:hypothetical protein